MLKESYENAQISIIEFENTDVITTSDLGGSISLPPDESDYTIEYEKARIVYTTVLAFHSHREYFYMISFGD